MFRTLKQWYVGRGYGGEAVYLSACPSEVVCLSVRLSVCLSSGRGTAK